MWSAPSDRERAERAEREARWERETARTPTMTLVDRIKRWREEPNGEETEDPVDLLCLAEEAMRRGYRTLISETTAHALATAIVLDLFRSGNEHAQRLVLTVDTPEPRDLGGWSRDAARHRIAGLLLKGIEQ